VVIEFWIVAAGLAVVAKSTYQSMQKQLTTRYDSLVIAQAAFLVSTAVFGAWLLVRWPVSVSPVGVALSGCAGGLVAGGTWAFIEALRDSDLSVVSPLQQTIPVVAALLEPVLVAGFGVEPKLLLAAGVTAVGAYTVSVERGNPWRPLRTLRERGPLLALLTAVLLGVASIVGHVTTQQLPVSVYVFVLAATATVLLFAAGPSRPPTVGVLGVYGLAFAANLWFSILALSLVAASQATVFFRLSLILNLVIGFVVFGERNVLFRVLGALVIIAGVVITVV
jgi:drug/metabolite transporter (DMT)-like permease